MSTSKNTVKTGYTDLTQTEVKQIAGRAGRYLENGSVTAFRARDKERIAAFLDPDTVIKPAEYHLFD